MFIYNNNSNAKDQQLARRKSSLLKPFSNVRTDWKFYAVFSLRRSKQSHESSFANRDVSRGSSTDSMRPMTAIGCSALILEIIDAT